MATIDLKLKSYDELQFEIMRLITDNYLKQQKINQLTNNWNELEEYLNHEIEEWQDVSDDWIKAQVYEDKAILDKMKEIKESEE